MSKVSKRRLEGIISDLELDEGTAQQLRDANESPAKSDAPRRSRGDGPARQQSVSSDF